jgi:hypothetical protein
MTAAEGPATVTPCVCGADEPCTGRCEKHDRDLHGYPCGPCGIEWEQANPRTAVAISRFAAGKGSAAAVSAARRADEATR